MFQNMMNEKEIIENFEFFKAGDLIFCPFVGNRKYTLFARKSKKFPLGIEDKSGFTFRLQRTTASYAFKRTEKNTLAIRTIEHKGVGNEPVYCTKLKKMIHLKEFRNIFESLDKNT